MADENQLAPEVDSLVVQARGFVIENVSDYERAGVLWQFAKDLRDQVAETFDGIIAKAHAAHKEAVAKKNRYDTPLAEAQKTFKARMGIFEEKEKQIRKAEEARLQIEAQRKEEEERLALAAALEEAGQKEAAAEIIDRPVEAPHVVLPKTTPKIDNLSFRTVWKFRITDQSKIPAEYMLPDLVKIGGVVRAMKKATNIPGVEPYEEKV